MFQAYWQWMSALQLPSVLLLGILIVVGHLFAIGVEKMRLPSIVGLLLAGVALGSSGLNLVNSDELQDLAFLPNIALAFVALSLGLEFKASTIKSLGAGISILIIFECLLTFALIAAGVALFTGSLAFGLACGAVGAASAPTAPLAIASEFKARGPLTRTIFAITGFDDAISIVIFSFASTLAVTLYSQSHTENLLFSLVLDPLLEIGLAVVTGIVLGFLYQLFTRKINEGSMLLLWVVGMMFLAEGLSHLFHFSLILSNMIMGAVIINRISSVQESKLMRGLENLMPIVLALFFVFAGAQFDARLLPTIGLVGLIYTVCRLVGKWLGASTGAMLGRLPSDVRKYSWAGLFSQMGVGLGLALVLIERFRPLGTDAVAMAQQVLVIVTATSIIFEIIAPITMKWALVQVGEIKLKGKNSGED